MKMNYREGYISGFKDCFELLSEHIKTAIDDFDSVLPEYLKKKEKENDNKATD